MSGIKRTRADDITSEQPQIKSDKIISSKPVTSSPSILSNIEEEYNWWVKTYLLNFDDDDDFHYVYNFLVRSALS